MFGHVGTASARSAPVASLVLRTAIEAFWRWSAELRFKKRSFGLLTSSSCWLLAKFPSPLWPLRGIQPAARGECCTHRCNATMMSHCIRMALRFAVGAGVFVRQRTSLPGNGRMANIEAPTSFCRCTRQRKYSTEMPQRKALRAANHANNIFYCYVAKWNAMIHLFLVGIIQ